MKKMKNLSKKNALVLMPIGMGVMAIAQLLFHYVELPDMVKGSLMGMGIGLLILSVIFGKIKPVR